MMVDTGTVEPIVTLSEARAYARIETGDEEALLAGLVRTSSALCEAFLGQVVIARQFAELVTAAVDWQRLKVQPVRSIDAIEIKGQPTQGGAFASDIDANGQGWVRLTSGGTSGPLTVKGIAGLAATQNDVPEPVRQGVLRLTAHLFAERDSPGGELPAAVAALWRPYRRMRLR